LHSLALLGSHAETPNPTSRQSASDENISVAPVCGVPQSPDFGLLSPFHEEDEQSCGKKEEEESAENPVDRCIGQSGVQGDRNGDEDPGRGHEDKKRDDHPSSRPALLVEKRPRQTSLVIQRPHAETSIAPCQESPSGRESPGFGSIGLAISSAPAVPTDPKGAVNAPDNSAGHGANSYPDRGQGEHRERGASKKEPDERPSPDAGNVTPGKAPHAETSIAPYRQILSASEAPS